MTQSNQTEKQCKCQATKNNFVFTGFCPIHQTEKHNSREQIIYSIDKGSPDGDMTALTIRINDTFHNFVGEEAEAILALIKSEKEDLLARVDKEIIPKTPPVKARQTGNKSLIAFGYSLAIKDSREQLKNLGIEETK